ncbi:hypothetical protein Q7C36_007030 [Tachysurus vachellii]|uniref:PDZ domain-containing protein n=1 Tax=Tachysurus vachellii TaxID=175792 RepID=A0AA88NBC0_TACVA|nr:uncharacterized protein si:dkey-92i15.4 [Tachysurus vachellii]XP_060726726.1 uncharacterized protein si:dkey-92i15.4 [Tachysurus vachellii]KAK2855161.1 hypothetical protein Q7C36_007030 [Tachysurus vachellii]
MDISGGSTCVPGLSAHLSESVARAGNEESIKCSEEQNKIQPCTAPTQTLVRFKIRSAKERQDMLNKGSSFKAESFDKGNRSLKVYREDLPKVHTISPPSPDTGMNDKRSRALNPLSLTKKPELSVGSETCSTVQKNLHCNESLTTNLRGRTALKQMYQSNRSKSLDWRGLKLEGGHENQLDVSSNNKDIEGRAMRRSESLMNSNELGHPLKRVSLHIQPLNGSGQRKQGSSGFLSSAVSGTSPVRTVALAQSFPARIKANQSQDRIEERESLWYSGNNATTPDIAEHPLSSQVAATKVKEITRNQTDMGRNGHTSLEDNSQTSSGIFHRIITPTPFSSVQATDSNLNHSKPTRSSVDRNISVSSLKKMKTVSYNPEKCGTFPKAPFKKEQMNFTTVPNTSVVLPNGKDTLDAMSTVSTEKPLSQDFISAVTNSDHDERRRTGNAIGLGTQSLGRTRHRHFTAPISFSVYGLSDSNSIQKSTKSYTERQDEKTTSNSKLTKSMESTAIPGKQSQSSQEFNPQNKPQSHKSMTADSEKLHPEHGIDLEYGSSGNPSKGQEPPLASVRNTIHKFEALALQSQSSSGIPHPRRAFSVTEKPRVVPSLNKTYSDRSLSKRWGDWKRESLKENLFSKSEVSDEAAAMPDLSGPVQTTTQDKDGIAMKAQIRGAKSQEHGVAQTLKQLDEFPSNQKNENLTTMYKNVDEPDFSKGSDLKSSKKPKNIESSEDKVRNYLSSTVSPDSQKSSGIANMSHSDLKISNIRDNLSTKDKPFQKEITTMLENSYSSTAVKTPSNLLSDSGGITSIEALGDFSNPYNTMKDEKVAAKVIRWIMDKGVEDDDDDDEEDEGTERGYDSDSGESSITITSNLSNRSFCMSLVELCSMGGLDLPVSDSSGSKDDDNWMSKRTVSMSSDVSALSSVTLLGMDELECLLNDVRGLEADALENYEDVHVVVLHKEAGSGLGFTVAGGVDQNKPVTVHKVLPTGLAAKEGSIHEGDQVLSINGTALHNSTHKDALQTMRKARGRGMTVVVIRRGDVTETCYSLKDSPQKAAEIPGSRVRITLNKSSSDLGFSLQGGVGSSLGDKPLTVQRLFQGGPVGKVFPGDELLEVEGQSLEGLRRLEVWYLIKRLPPGPVEVLLQRAQTGFQN